MKMHREVGKAYFDFIAFMKAEKPVVNEDRMKIFSDCLRHQGRGHGGINPARNAADSPSSADLHFNLVDGVVDERTEVPREVAAAEFKKTLQKRRSERRMGHLGMKLNAVNL